MNPQAGISEALKIERKDMIEKDLILYQCGNLSKTTYHHTWHTYLDNTQRVLHEKPVEIYTFYILSENVVPFIISS
jgi:hypothetical protein